MLDCAGSSARRTLRERGGRMPSEISRMVGGTAAAGARGASCASGERVYAAIPNTDRPK